MFILSPVSIHTFILAILNFFIVSGTFSCNLSSTIVVPIKNKSLSIILFISSTFLSLSFSDICALVNFCSYWEYSSWDNIFIAIKRVLNPFEENLST